VVPDVKTCVTCRHDSLEKIPERCMRCTDWQLWEPRLCPKCLAPHSEGEYCLPPTAPVAVADEAGPVVSDGGSTSYYEIPEGATELNDLIEHKKMSFALGNIFKACYRLGEKSGTDAAYDVRKMIFFANRILRQLEKA
jgi:hypothetical protein